MCLLIVKPAGVSFPPDWVEVCENAHFINDDGMGYGTRTNIFKTVSLTPKQFAQKTISEIPKSVAAIIHFRWSTGGLINHTNCHPFKIKDGTIFAHNGVIESDFPSTKFCSDTAVLAESVDNYSQLHNACTKLSGAGNKFALLHPNASKVAIYGENHGEWCNGLWYSNSSYKRDSFVVTGFRDKTPTPVSNKPEVSDWIELEQDVYDMFEKHDEYKVASMFEDIRDLVSKYGWEAVEEMVDFMTAYSHR